jgi:uroporphyrinogen decarboxylase
MMRQAGRYLPEYRAVRKKYDFLTMCHTPELVAEVSIQPVDIVGVDACIIFSDILVIPEAMGMHLVVEEGKGGPQFPKPLRSRADIDALRRPEPNTHLQFVMDALRLTSERLAGRVPLIGFAGSPWTLASYMVEGKGSKSFRYMKELIYSSPDDAHALLALLADSVADYLNAKIDAGAQAVQIFDTWGGLLPPDQFKEFSLQYIERTVSQLSRDKAPVIVFCKDTSHSLEAIADIGADVVGIDWTIDMADAKKRIGDKVAIQGNLDPTMLYAPPEKIRRGVMAILEKFGNGSGHIFNLGHGILPDIPPEHAKEFVRAVKEESGRFHT